MGWWLDNLWNKVLGALHLDFRILITGAGGQLGSECVKELSKQKKYKIIGCGTKEHSELNIPYYIIDITDELSIKQFIKKIKPNKYKVKKQKKPFISDKEWEEFEEEDDEMMFIDEVVEDD